MSVDLGREKRLIVLHDTLQGSGLFATHTVTVDNIIPCCTSNNLLLNICCKSVHTRWYILVTACACQRTHFIVILSTES